MSIQIIRREASIGGNRTEAPVTDNTKLARVYTDGFLPDQIVAPYTLVYEKGTETYADIIFPQATGEDDTFVVDLIDDGGDPLNGAVRRVDSNTEINFTAIISGASLDTLNMGVNLFYRNISLDLYTETETTTTQEFPFFLFRISEESLHFESLDVTRKRLYVRMYSDLNGTREVVARDNLTETDRNNLYRVEYQPLTEFDIQRSNPISRGFVDDSNPNAYIIDFERTDFSNDLDDRYNIIFNKEGFIKDANSNSLFGETQELQITSQPQVVERLDYMTRITYNSQERSQLDWTAPNGLIDVPDLGVLLYQYRPSEGQSGATPSDADYTQFYMLAQLEGFSPNATDALTMNGQYPSSAQGLFGTKKWGPFNKGETIQIFGEMDSGQVESALILKSYCILTEPADDGTPQVSTLDMPTMRIELNRANDSIDDPVDDPEVDPTTFQPPTKLFTLNTSEITLQSVEEMASGGSFFTLPEDQWSWELLFDTGINDPVRVFMYRFRLEEPSTYPMLDAILQFRRVYDDGRPVAWENVPNNWGDYARGVPSSELTPVLLTSRLLETGQRYIDIGLQPFRDSSTGATPGNSVYEFRTIAVDYPDTERSPIPNDQFLMFANPPVDDPTDVGVSTNIGNTGDEI